MKSVATDSATARPHMMLKPAIHIIEHAALSADLKARILALCRDAYEEDFTPYFALLQGATHVLAIKDGQLVSHGAWVRRELRYGSRRRPLSCAYVEAVATPVHLQRQGFGTLVIQAIPPLLQGYDIAALSPSEPGFYARSGWEMWRGPLFFMKDGQRFSTPDEDVMIYRLPGTPADLDLQDELETDWRQGDVW